MLMQTAALAKALKPNFAPRLNLPAFLTRPFVPLYHQDTVNHCPACGGRHWHIGRSTAECAFCATALPLTMPSAQSVEPAIVTTGGAAGSA